MRGLSRKNGGLAQLARAPALHAGGQRFESVILHAHCPPFGGRTPRGRRGDKFIDILGRHM